MPHAFQPAILMQIIARPTIPEAACLLFLFILCLTSFWALRRSGTAPSRFTTLVIALLWTSLPVAVGWMAVRYRNPVLSVAVPTDRPVDMADTAAVQRDGYVSSRSCRECHPGQYAAWHRSYHRTMTQVADTRSVVGNFNQVTLKHEGAQYDLTREGDRFWIEMPSPGRQTTQGNVPRVKLPIVMTTGSHHMQVYWFASGRDRMLGRVPLVYLISEKQWVPSRASFLVAPQIRPEPIFGEWNTGCLRCHTTHPQPQVSSSHMDSRAIEFGIACEACHGPGETHIRVNQNPLRRYQYHLGGGRDGTIVNPARLPSHLSTQVCGNCHGVDLFKNRTDWQRWMMDGFRFRPGDELADFRTVVRPSQEHRSSIQRVLEKNPNFLSDLFWADGMIRITGRELNALVETPCYQKGELACTSCHQLHKAPDDPRPPEQWADDQLAFKDHANRMCSRCHADVAAADRLPQHSHHDAESTGSVCLNCHMPHTTYGVLRAIRSHRIDIPDVAASVATGRPNACNQCHLDKTLSWAASYLWQWYGTSPPSFEEDQRTFSASVLWLLRGDAGQRALTAWTLGWRSAQEASRQEWLAPALAQLLVDPYPAVRLMAYRSLRSMPAYRGFEYDYVGSDRHLAAARIRALEIFDHQRRPSGMAALAVLLDENGSLMTEVVDRLLQQRNDRPISLAE